MSHTRRSFLQLGALGATSALLSSRAHAHAGERVAHDPDATTLPEDARAFPLGVAAGDPMSTSVQLWTRHEGDRRLRLVVWRAHDEKENVRTWRQVVHHDVAERRRGPVTISVDELTPNTEYRYAFYALDGDAAVARTRVGRFKTAPRENALVPVSMGATCCIMNGMPQGVLRAAGERRDLDVLVQLGDAVYADGCETLDEYDARWADNLARPGYQAMRASTALVATWDDHEVDNDWCPASVDPAKLDAAKAAFFGHMPVCREGLGDHLWRKLRFGKTVELFVLDSRGERIRECAPKQYISRAQMDWLKRGLQESDAMFKVVVNTVPITRFPSMFSSSRQDRWETFPEQRIELLSHIESSNIPGVLFLAGDFHLAMIARASATGVGARTTEILAGPGAQVGHPLVPWLFGKQFDWASNKNNVATLRFDPARARVDVEYMDDRGATFHRAAYRRRHSLGFDKIEDWLL